MFSYSFGGGEELIHPVYRFVARHSLFIGPGMGFVLAAYAMSRIEAPWPAWVVLVTVIAVIWTIPVWRRQKETALSSADDFQQQLPAGRISLLHFYSDF